MIIKQAILRIQTEPPLGAHGNSFRGYVASKFPQYDILHNHRKSGGFLYLYPRVQFRVLKKKGFIIGIDEGVTSICEIEPLLETITVNENDHRIIEKKLILKNVQFGFSDSVMKYEFVKPWLALNEKNYRQYIQMGNKKNKNLFLMNILIGNLLSLSKSLGYIVEQEIKIESLFIKEIKTFLKGIPMIGFLGAFSINFEIPDYWGIGKSVSRGFGTIKRVLM